MSALHSMRSSFAAVALGLAVAQPFAGAARTGGAAPVALPEPKLDGGVSVEAALARRRSIRKYADAGISLAAASQLLWAAQGVTDRGGGRTAPSAGALYPIELYLVAGRVDGLRPGVYRYEPEQHRLIARRTGDVRPDLADAALEQHWVAEAPAIVIIAGVYERTMRKYRRRAPRYVHMEVGHVAQNVYLQAVALGLGTTMVGAFRDEALARVLVLGNREAPLGVMPIGKPR